MSLSPAELRLECLRLATGPSVPPETAVARAQAYIDFLLAKQPSEPTRKGGPL